MRVALAMRNKNQSDLSRAFGVSRTLISQKMRGVTSWTIQDMEKAGKYLQIAPFKFLDPNGLISEWGRRGLNPGPHGYLFPGRWGGHVEASYVGSHLAHILGEPWTAHSLRHRYATVTYESTHDLLLVQRLLGHASVRTTQIYVALPDARLRAGLDAVRLVV